MSSNPPKIVVVGSANIDLVARAPHLPTPGETVIGSDFEMLPGGKGANQAVAAARLGATTHFVGRIGGDLFAKTLEDSLTTAGVHTGFLIRDPNAPTGVALIGVSKTTGENNIIVAPGANGRVCPTDIQVAKEVIRESDTVILSLEIPIDAVEAALDMATSAGVRTILNPAPAMVLSDNIIKTVSVLTPNEHEVGILAGMTDSSPIDAARALVKRGAWAVVVTLGADGALAVTSDGKEVYVPAESVTNVVDTTAAGDCYTAALAVALSEGSELQDAMKVASIAASISVTRRGAQSSLPTRSEVDTLLNETTEKA